MLSSPGRRCKRHPAFVGRQGTYPNRVFRVLEQFDLLTRAYIQPGEMWRSLFFVIPMDQDPVFIGGPLTGLIAHIADFLRWTSFKSDCVYFVVVVGPARHYVGHLGAIRTDHGQVFTRRGIGERFFLS